ncbi:DUF2631 domain-containing protein [Catenuloplanes indicus]|uniref:DUF2631 domain-containing protein n=1 Tax=Catenuloplanes indicus TaxID=137267 RepID=A0AAE4B024_9ACTN|nr:DUF2631 domain-containing protein [Catenuloplanes indicus]MDQ0369092.1 hypothetical protein [Catenuloplanes indicus]
MADSEPVVAPDQLKPGNRRAGRILGVLTILSLLACTLGNHEGNIENIFLVVIAAGIAVTLIGDVVLRRAGLRE